MTYEQDTETTPVLFRVHRSPQKYGSEVTAVFPCEPATTDGNTMSCYAHIGEHGQCSWAWYYVTRPATLEEYAALKAELESEPYGYRLAVYQRITRQLRDRFHVTLANLRRVLSMTDIIWHGHAANATALVILPWEHGTTIAKRDNSGQLYGCRDVTHGPAHDAIVKAWVDDSRDRLGLAIDDQR